VFHALVSGGTGTYTSFAWNFGDGGVGSGPVVSYTFQHPGKFSVALDVVDSSNSSATSSLTVSVATPTGSGSPWSSLGPTTLATAGIVGAGLTFGVFYGVRRRHSARLAEGDPEEYAAVPPGAVGPLPPSLGAAGPSEEGSSVALAPAAAESSASVSASSTPSLPSSLVRPEVVAPTTALARPRRVRPPGEEPRRWSRDIVAYLGALPTLGPDDVPTLDWTQKGMSDRLHTGQNQISNVLRRLLASGVVVERLEHVQGQPRRLKVYRLTLRGEALARDIRRRRPISNPNLLRREW